MAAKLFPYERAISTGPGYFSMLNRRVDEAGLADIIAATDWDPGAADLLTAQSVFASRLGKTNEAMSAYNRLKALAPRADIVREIEGKK